MDIALPDLSHSYVLERGDLRYRLTHQSANMPSLKSLNAKFELEFRCQISLPKVSLLETLKIGPSSYHSLLVKEKVIRKNWETERGPEFGYRRSLHLLEFH